MSFRNDLSSCHPEPALFAGEGTAFRTAWKKKQIPHPVQKANGVRNDILLAYEFFFTGRQQAASKGSE
jgi:hypothetical protein